MSIRPTIIVVASFATVVGCSRTELGLADYGPETVHPTEQRLSVGDSSACAIRRDGRVLCWGGEAYRETAPRPRLLDLPGAAIVLPTRAPHCVILAGGAPYCWQFPFELFASPTCRRPKGAQYPPECSALQRVAVVESAVDIATQTHSCLVSADGRVFCAGHSPEGQIGGPADGVCGGPFVPCQPVPLAVPGLSDVRRVVAAPWGSCALHRNGDVTCWGASASAGVEIETVCGGRETPTTCSPPTGLGLEQPIADIDVSGISCALSTRGIAWCWSPGAVPGHVTATRPRRIPNIPDAQQIVAAGAVPCIRTGDGSVWCWAVERADETGTFYGEATRVAGLPPIVELRAGWQTLCGRTADDEVWCWGSNDYGVIDGLGANATTAPFRVLDAGLTPHP